MSLSTPTGQLHTAFGSAWNFALVHLEEVQTVEILVRGRYALRQLLAQDIGRKLLDDDGEKLGTASDARNVAQGAGRGRIVGAWFQEVVTAGVEVSHGFEALRDSCMTQSGLTKRFRK